MRPTFLRAGPLYREAGIKSVEEFGPGIFFPREQTASTSSRCSIEQSMPDSTFEYPSFVQPVGTIYSGQPFPLLPRRSECFLST